MSDININQELSILTTIDPQTFNKLDEKKVYCISDAVYKNMLSKNTKTSIDIGIGTVEINILNDCIKYRFVPSKFLENTIINTITKGQNELTYQLEKSLIRKLTNI